MFVLTFHNLVKQGNDMGSFNIFKNKKNDDNSQDPIKWFSGEDVGMTKAIKEAQANYDIFLKELTNESRRIIPAMTVCLIKYAFPYKDGSFEGVEHMFLSDIYIENDTVFGTLNSESFYTDIKEGTKITVDRNFVSDWLYVIDEKTYGGFTFKYMWNTFSDEEKLMYGNEPPFCWIDK